MVLLFLGVIFLLLGLRAVGVSTRSEDNSSAPASTTGTSTTAAPASSTSGKPAPNQAEVRVYNISQKEGIAAHAADQLKAAGFKVTDVTNLSVSDIATTTVYYGDAEGEKATADAVGKNLGAPVEARIDALKSQPPGVIVLVTG